MNKLLTIIFLCLLAIFISSPVQAQIVTNECIVTEVLSGDMFKCSDKTYIKIWGIQAPIVPPAVDEKTAQINGGLKARDYLKSYILNETLICSPKGLLESGIVAQCIKDLKVKTIDIADPLLIGGYVKELKNVTKGYYSNPDRPKSE